MIIMSKTKRSITLIFIMLFSIFSIFSLSSCSSDGSGIDLIHDDESGEVVFYNLKEERGCRIQLMEGITNVSAIIEKGSSVKVKIYTYKTVAGASEPISYSDKLVFEHEFNSKLHNDKIFFEAPETDYYYMILSGDFSTGIVNYEAAGE